MASNSINSAFLCGYRKIECTSLAIICFRVTSPSGWGSSGGTTWKRPFFDFGYYRQWIRDRLPCADAELAKSFWGCPLVAVAAVNASWASRFVRFCDLLPSPDSRLTESLRMMALEFVCQKTNPRSWALFTSTQQTVHFPYSPIWYQSWFIHVVKWILLFRWFVSGICVRWWFGQEARLSSL